MRSPAFLLGLVVGIQAITVSVWVTLLALLPVAYDTFVVER